MHSIICSSSLFHFTLQHFHSVYMTFKCKIFKIKKIFPFNDFRIEKFNYIMCMKRKKKKIQGRIPRSIFLHPLFLVNILYRKAPCWAQFLFFIR